jgi:predicted MPP superfamily phosphohydrolase
LPDHLQPTMELNRRKFLKFAAGTGSLALTGSYPFYIERQIVLKSTYRIPVPNLPRSFAGFRIVQLSDVHYGFLVPLSFVGEVIRRTNESDGDIIVCTGDYVHERNSTRQIDAVWPLLGELRAPLGVYSVLGNHDHLADTARSVEWLQRTGQDLSHRQTAIERGPEKLWLVGAGDLWEDHRNLDVELEGIPDSDCRIVLAHNPDTVDTRYSSRIDLMISGHTHGGQVVLPFIGPPFLPVHNKTYSSGLKVSPKGTRVFITRGIGWSVYPVRFNCFPEIAVLELEPA